MSTPASTAVLTLLLCWTALCDEGIPEYQHVLSHGLDDTVPHDDRLNSQYNSLIKSFNEVHELKQRNKHAQSENKIPERVEEELPPPEKGECSVRAAMNVAALLRASKLGNSRHIASLVALGTPVDAVDENGDGRTALHWAVTKGKLAAARQLLDLGASINRPASGIPNNTPLHVAASLGDLEMVQLLVENGANIAAFNSQCLTPLDLSNIHVHEAVSKWLHENADKYLRCQQMRVTSKWGLPEQESTPATSFSREAASSGAANYTDEVTTQLTTQ